MRAFSEHRIFSRLLNFAASLLEVASDEEEILFKLLLPRDSIVAGETFLVRNFIVGRFQARILLLETCYNFFSQLPHLERLPP
jgi:hypothetical protein